MLAQQKRVSTPAVQPSAHTKQNHVLPNLPPNTTHVYTKQHKALGFQPSFAGPFPIIQKLSRSTVKIKVGNKVNGEPIYEVRHLNDLKAADPDSHVSEATRAKRGRPKTTAEPTDETKKLIASIDFSKPPPSLKAWSASQEDLENINAKINQRGQSVGVVTNNRFEK